MKETDGLTKKKNSVVEETSNIRIIDKKEFIERFLHDQKASKKRIKTTNLSFKDETYIDIMNSLYEEYGEKVNVTKEKGLIVKYKGQVFNIKVIAKRDRVKI